MGPFNDKFSQYLENIIIPSLKTSAYREEEVDNSVYIREMLDLKDIYKIFERC